jgi:glucokinase
MARYDLPEDSDQDLLAAWRPGGPGSPVVEPRVIVAVEVAAGRIASALVRDTGEAFEHESLAAPVPGSGDALLGRLGALVTDGIHAARQAGCEPAAVALATPGIVDPDTGDVVGEADLPGWTADRPRRRLTELTGLPTLVMNDGHAAAWGEWRLGSGRGSRHMVMLVLDATVTGGVVADGRLVTGHRGAGGRLGHLPVEPGGHACPCGGAGCLEQYASGPALARAARAAIERGARFPAGAPREPGIADIVAAARAGDETALALLAEAGRHVGAALAALVTLLGPEVIVLGGSLPAAGHLVLGPAREALEHWLPARLARDLALRSPRLGEQAALVGAALRGWERLAPA